MARPVRVRTTYTGDRSRLSRLEEAVEKDSRLSPETRNEVLELLRRLIAKLIELDATSVAATTAAIAGKKRSK